MAALGFSRGFEEGLKFILPGYFTGVLLVEMKGRWMLTVCALSWITAVPGALLSPGWGWLATATAASFLVWRWEQWNLRVSKSY